VLLFSNGGGGGRFLSLNFKIFSIPNNEY